MQKFVAVYGTLKSTYYNNRYLGNSELIGTDYIPIKCIHDVGFPVVKFDPDLTTGRYLKVEVYKVTSKQTMKALDALEGEGYMYKRKEVTTEGGQQVEAYEYISPVVEHCEWVNNNQLILGN